MKRQIKFRGWFQQFNGQEFWVYGYYYVDHNTGNHHITDGQTDWCVDNVSQFTGLKDKNGAEIYESDILTWVNKSMKYIVAFEDGSFVCNHINKEYGRWGLLS